MLKEFKEFIMRGNVLDLAVGVVIGGAFTAIVDSVVKGLITPLVGLIISLLTGSKEAFKGMAITINGVELNYGLVIDAIITFLITAFVVFMIVKAANKARSVIEKPQAEEPVAEPEPTSEDYLKEIRDLLAKEDGEK